MLDVDRNARSGTNAFSSRIGYRSNVNTMMGMSPKSSSRSALDRDARSSDAGTDPDIVPHHTHLHNSSSGSSHTGNRYQYDPPVEALQTCLSSSTRWFQLIMFVAFAIAFVMALTSKYDNLSPGLIWGAVLSCFSVFFVILSYASVPAYRQHPNPLVFWRTIADAFFVLQLLTQQFARCLFYDCDSLCNDSNLQCGCSHADGAGPACDVFAGLFEFSLIAAECWFFCMTLNLLVSLTNPFTDFQRNTRFFHVFCWGSGFVMGLVLMTTNDWAGYSDLGVCWTNALRNLEPPVASATCATDALVIENFSKESYKVVRANIISWVFFYVWMGLFLLCSIATWLWAWKRLSEGMPETYAVRVQSINRARFNVLAVTFYWLIVGAVYLVFLARDDKSQKDVVSELLNFLIAGKGYVDLVIWFALNDFRVAHLTRWCFGAQSDDVDVDLNPQVNAALRREVLFYTTSGIIQAVQAAERLPASQRIQHLALLPQTKRTGVNGALNGGATSSSHYMRQQSTDALDTDGGGAFDEHARVTSKSSERTKTFHDYEPHAFKKIRERFGVDNDAYLQSLSATAKERLSEGASGAFMFFSADGSLIVKSTSKDETTFLRSIAQQYADYLCAKPHSLLTRFYGCHCLELYGKQFSFIVMANLFDTDQVIHSRFDIKGSWVNRHGDLPKRGKKVTCRHCNSKYVFQSTRPEATNCPERLGGHEPNVVLKDSDLTQKLKLDRDVAMQLFKQLCADSDLLCSFGIMDYSLLMGINEVEYVVDENGSFDDVPTGLPSPLGIGIQTTMHNNNNNNTTIVNPFSEQSMLMSQSSTNNALASSGGAGMTGSRNRHHVSVSSTANGVDGATTARPRKVSRQRDPLRNTRSESNASVASSGRRLPRSGMRMANTVVGPAYYHLGVIDILQTWTLSKRMERFAKIVFKGVDGDGLSAIQPKLYNVRFQAKLAEILGVEDRVDANAVGDLFTQQNSHMDVDTRDTSHFSVQSIRSLPSSDHHFLSSVDSHYADSRGSTNVLRQRSLEHSQSQSQSQSVGQDTEEFAGIDYHL